MSLEFDKFKEELRQKITENPEKLPISLQNIDFTEMKVKANSKRIEIKKYRTKSYSISGYYKHVTKFI